MDTDLEFRLLLDKINRNKGVDFSLYKENTLKRRIGARLKSTGCRDYTDYMVYLNREPAEYDTLIQDITINVTEFFRNPEVFEVIGKAVIPAIIKDKARDNKRVIRVWSAGTSEGEEAYSMTILFLELLGTRIADYDITVYGTDIDPVCVKKAREGRYDRAKIAGVKANLLDRYFTKRDELYEVRKDAKRLTRFLKHNLIADKILPRVDLILCRNVVIYFTRPLQEMVYSIFARALNPGGFLVLGKVESLSGYARTNFETIDNVERVYRRIP